MPTPAKYMLAFQDLVKITETNYSMYLHSDETLPYRQLTAYISDSGEFVSSGPDHLVHVFAMRMREGSLVALKVVDTVLTERIDNKLRSCEYERCPKFTPNVVIDQVNGMHKECAVKFNLEIELEALNDRIKELYSVQGD